MNGNIGISLSGGGARATAHLGVLQALNENGIFPNRVSGASAGSIIGSLYCLGNTPLQILELSREQSFLKIFRIGFFNKGMTELTYLKSFLEEHFPTNSFDELKIPLHISVSNINSGDFEIISNGEIIKPLLASCALPLIFKAIKMNGSLYVDGGLLNNLPVEILMTYCDKIIGSSVCPHEERSDIKGFRHIGERCLQLAIYNTVKPRLPFCDIALEITDAYGYSMFDFKKSDALFEIGYDAAMDQMENIKKKLI